MTKGYFLRLAALLSLTCAYNLFAHLQPQPPPQSQVDAASAQPNAARAPSKNKAKPTKVWTNEDLEDTRTARKIQSPPKDVAKGPSQDASDKPEASRPERANVPTGPVPKLSDSSPIPNTVAETERKIDIARNEIRQMQSTLGDTRTAFAEATDDVQRARLRVDMDLIRDDLRERQDDLKQLQDRLEMLKRSNGELKFGQQ
jgi:hypothetical protein